MIEVKWKGKIGFGDILSPLSYAHHLSAKLHEEVNLTFVWPNDEHWLYTPADPEPLWHQVDYFNGQVVKRDTNVEINHFFSTPTPSNWNHTSYRFTDGFHNWWWPKFDERDRTDPRLVVVGSSQANKEPLKAYGKGWKDPIGERWPRLLANLKAANPYLLFVVVDYRMPVAKMYPIIKNAGAFIGYHGAAAWVARFAHVPSIIFAGDVGLAHTSFPNALIFSDLMETFPRELNKYITAASNKCHAARYELEAYKFPRTITDILERAP